MSDQSAIASNAVDIGFASVDALAAIYNNNIPETTTRARIDQNGCDSTTVKFVEPYLGAAKKNGRVPAYASDATDKHFIISGWFTTPQWAKAHPDLVNRFAAIMHETAVWANRNPAKSGEIPAKYTKIDPGVIATMPAPVTRKGPPR